MQNPQPNTSKFNSVTYKNDNVFEQVEFILSMQSWLKIQKAT